MGPNRNVRTSLSRLSGGKDRLPREPLHATSLSRLSGGKAVIVLDLDTPEVSKPPIRREGLK